MKSRYYCLYASCLSNFIFEKKKLCISIRETDQKISSLTVDSSALENILSIKVLDLAVMRFGDILCRQTELQYK